MRRVAPVIIAFALVVAACGGDDTIAKAEFVERADAICKAADEELDALGEPSGLDDLVEQLEEGRAIYQRLREDVAELDRPDEDADEIEELFAILDELIAGVDEMLVAARDSDAEALADAGNRLDELSAEAEVKAGALGFEECGVDTEPDGDTTDDEPAAFDIADYPPDLEPVEDEVALLAPVISEQADGLFTEDEVDCMVRFVLSRVTLAEMEPVARQLGEAAALECVPAERLVEIGIEANASPDDGTGDGTADDGAGAADDGAGAGSDTDG